MGVVSQQEGSDVTAETQQTQATGRGDVVHILHRGTLLLLLLLVGMVGDGDVL
jgi:hypothetical protein